MKSIPDILKGQVPEKQQDFGENRVKERKQASDNQGNIVTDSFQPTPEPLRHDLENLENRGDSLYDSPKVDRAMLNGLRDRFRRFPHRATLPLNFFRRSHAHTTVYLMPLVHSLSTVQRKNLGTSHTKNRPKRCLLHSPLGVIHGFGAPSLPAPPAASAPEREEVGDFAVAIVGREAER